MKKLIVLIAAIAAFAVIAAPASAKPITTYWVCGSNGVAHSHGTTQIHIHKRKPSPRHMRRHHCVKRTTGAPAGTVVTLPDGSKLVVGPGGSITINVTQTQSQSQSQQNQSSDNGCGSCNQPGEDNGGESDHGHHGGHGDKGHGHGEGSCD